MFKLPPRRTRTPWGALFWIAPMAYVLIDPYNRGAHWVEWVLTLLALAIFVALYIVGLAYSDDRKIMARAAIGILILALVCFAFRYSGAVMFTLVAAFAPFIVGGRILKSAGLVALVLGLMWLEWWLLSPVGSWWPTYLSINGGLVAAGTTFVSRLIPENERDLRVAERERIARDLHDVLGHTLSSITLKSELAGRLFYDKPARALAEINDVERIAREALAEVRQAIHGYHAGDVRAEFERAETMLRAAGVSAERHMTHVVIDPAQERVLAMALREAVTNVVRHANAKTCWLALYRLDGVYRLEVKDDGCGGTISEGLGVRSMRTRVEALGGRVAWHGESGMRVVIDLPQSASAA